MAGRVLRNSKGQYAGSTRGWGRGRTTHGGGFDNRKGKTKQLRTPEQTRRMIGRGASIGVAVGGTVATHALARRAVGSSKPKTMAGLAAVAVVVANAGGINAKRLSTRTTRRR